MKAHLLEDSHVLGSFDGGLKLDSNKQISSGRSILRIDPPGTIVLPLHQHIGEIGELLVEPGDRVLKGQMLARPKQLISAAVHSPVSGTVQAIEQRPVPHPSGLTARSIIIDNDGEDEWVDRDPVGDDFHHMNSHDLRNIIRDAGIVGLGGATFPSSVKQTEININTLIINGVECEPYITCDDMLMRERAREIITGADIIGHIIKARECIIAIEDNKPEAIAAMTEATEADGTGFFKIEAVPTIYPSGGEKQIIKVLTGREVPMNGLPADIDILCQNVGTAYATQQAIYEDIPLISRIVTVTGNGITSPVNMDVPIGTSMDVCIEHADGYTEHARQLIMGGPMMGFTLPSDELPVVKATNCLLVTDETSQAASATKEHDPCIRCGQCVDVCPARLLPQQLYWYASSQNFERLVEHNLFDCIECGCCAYVCPSEIPLVQYYRFAKTEIWEQDSERKKSDHARRRHEQREARLLRQKQEREEKMRKKREALQKKKQQKGGDGKNDAIAAALARVQAKKEQRDVRPKNTDNLSDEQQQLIDAVDRRREQAKRESRGEGDS